jgi:mannose-1-phosphate guanylyltransferase
MIAATIQQRRGAIVLAGGEGTRLQSLAAALFGASVPKQYCSLFGSGQTMLDISLRRVAPSVRPQWTATVFVRKHRRFYEHLAANGQTGELVVQPENRGTAPAVLYGLLRLAKRVQRELSAALHEIHSS